MHSESATLADGELVLAVVAAEHAAVAVDDLARPAQAGAAVAAQEGAAAEACHEAEVLALALVRHRQAGVAGEGADGVLGQAAEREAEPVEQRRVELGEHVALVLARIDSGTDERSVAVARDARVVTGGEARRAERGGELEHGVEANLAVAAHAGVRGKARGVAVEEAVDHLGAKALAQVERDVRDTHAMSQRPGPGDRLRRAAGALAVRGGIGPELERDRDHIVAGIEGELRGGGTI